LKFRISKRAHLGQIETLQFAGRTDALADQSVDQPISEVGNCEDDPYQRRASNDLRDELARVTVE
jgi:hypothetical protein